MSEETGKRDRSDDPYREYQKKALKAEETEENDLEDEDEIEEQPQKEVAEPISMDELISFGRMIGPVQIDGIDFYLLGKIVPEPNETTVDNIKYNRYTKVAVLSVTPSDSNPMDPSVRRNLFWVYRSQSEVGMWRICYSMEKEDQFNKLTLVDIGFGDYVQTTLIHINLQAYINARFEELVLYNGRGNLLYERITQNSVPQGQMHLKYERKGIPNEVITCGVYNPVLNSEIDPTTREIQSTTSPFNLMPIKCGQRMARIKKSGQTEATPQPIPLKYVMDSLRKFSNAFGNAYSIESDPILIQPDYFSRIVPQSSEWSIIIVSGDIYSVTLVSNKTQSNAELQKVKLIYLKTKSIVGVPTAREPVYYMPITLVPESSRCNSYGLYSRYIRVGMYICKLFEYDSQCIEGESENKCTETYTFIGNRYVNLFPYLALREREIKKEREKEQIPEVATQQVDEGNGDTQTYGGKGRSRRVKRKTRKHRKSKRKNRKSKKRKTHKRLFK